MKGRCTLLYTKVYSENQTETEERMCMGSGAACINLNAATLPSETGVIEEIKPIHSFRNLNFGG